MVEFSQSLAGDAPSHPGTLTPTQAGFSLALTPKTCGQKMCHLALGNVPFSLGSDTYHPHLLVHPKHVAQNVPFFSGLVQLTPPPTTWRTGPFPPKNVAQGQPYTLDGLTRRVRSHQTRILVKFHILYGHLKKVLELQSAVFQII